MELVRGWLRHGGGGAPGIVALPEHVLCTVDAEVRHILLKVRRREAAGATGAFERGALDLGVRLLGSWWAVTTPTETIYLAM